MVTATFMRIVSCWKPSVQGENSNGTRDSNSRVSGLLWHKDIAQHVYGEFSMAVVQANNLLEDHSQVESGTLGDATMGPPGTFIGVYDGHGGPEAARFVNDNLFNNLKRLTSENQGMSADIISKAYIATEEAFLGLVKKEWTQQPQIASVGACCLAGVVCDGALYIANAGDSRAILGKLDNSVKAVKAIQLSAEHNASIESVRDELHKLHPDDPYIVVQRRTVWRVKGLIQVSRSIGDAYLKRSEFNKPPLLQKFRLRNPFDKQILSPEPSVLVHKLCPEDQFVIFASDGLWEHLSNQEAVDMVNTHPRSGIAKRLVKAAICKAAKKREMRYSDLKKIGRGIRRHFHDDITVVVLYLDFHLISQNKSHGPHSSVRGAGCLPAYLDS
ncbi:hypothetical protein V2J09_008291 [Rumex salicifolius]